MRSKDAGAIEHVAQQFNQAETWEMWRKMCFSRFFEFNVKEAFDRGLFKMPIYLSIGQEAISSALSTVYKNPHIFAQHRCHDIYLAYGGKPEALRDELLQRPTGCTKGMGGSASIHDPSINMFGHDGLMGTQIPIAVGYAFANGKPTLAIMGDASGEEDYSLAALGWAAHRKIPVLFVCTDNGLSILTKVDVRRKWKISDVAASFGMPTVEIADDPWLIMHHAKKLMNSLPAFMNILTVRNLWHSGTGVDALPEWDRFELVKEQMKALGYGDECRKIEEEEKNRASRVWEDRLAVAA